MSSLGLSEKYPILISTTVHLHALARLDPTIVLPYPLSATRRGTGFFHIILVYFFGQTLSSSSSQEPLREKEKTRKMTSERHSPDPGEKNSPIW